MKQNSWRPQWTTFCKVHRRTTCGTYKIRWEYAHGNLKHDQNWPLLKLKHPLLLWFLLHPCFQLWKPLNWVLMRDKPSLFKSFTSSPKCSTDRFGRRQRKRTKTCTTHRKWIYWPVVSCCDWLKTQSPRTAATEILHSDTSRWSGWERDSTHDHSELWLVRSH